MVTEREAQLLLYASAAGIASQKELANFMAQVSHESQGLTQLDESFQYTQGIDQITVKSARGDGTPAALKALEDARVEALRGHPEKLGDLMYGGRMGNDQPGDGYKYHGRGYIQLTGKNQYSDAGKALGLDLVNHPELAAQPEYAGQLAAWYWMQRVHHIAPEDVTKATLLVNGGSTGLADRKERFAKWEKTLTSEVMTDLAKGKIALPIEPASHHATTVDGTLRQGAHGAAVNALQADLAALGYTDNRGQLLRSDGHYGRNTEAAVRAFQGDHGLLSDGVAGKYTLEAMQGQRALRYDTPALAPELPGPPPVRVDGFAPANRAPAPRDPRAPALPEATTPSVNPFADPRHPDHGLYAELKERIPDASENRLAQMAAACHMAGIKPGRLGDIHIGRYGIVLSPDGGPGLGAMVDNSLPAPPIQQTVQHVQAYDQQRELQRQMDAQQAMQQGPVMGGSGGPRMG